MLQAGPGIAVILRMDAGKVTSIKTKPAANIPAEFAGIAFRLGWPTP